jgi:hypothetical protein
VTVTLAPGESALFTIDRSAPGQTIARPEEAVELAAITRWRIRVESWDAGSGETLTEDRGLGYRTNEFRPTTAVEVVECGVSSLAPWHSLPEVGPDVSGVGQYEATFTVDESRDEAGRILLDLGSTCGGLGSVSVNGGPRRGFDTSRPIVDITDDVCAGSNSVVVRVSSSLNNRLLARGYYDGIPDRAAMRVGIERSVPTSVRPYGLIGPVRVMVERPSLR